MPIVTCIVTGQYPSLVALPSTPSPLEPLLIHIAGSGEVGPVDGSNLAVLYNNGPLKLIQAGSTRFDGQVVAGIQLPNTTFSLLTLDATIASIIAAYGCDPLKVTISGLSLGGNAVMGLLTRLPRHYAAALVIAPAMCPSNAAPLKVACDRLWLWQDDQDPVVTPSWVTGAQSGYVGVNASTWDRGWGTVLSGGERCLDTHPDHPTCSDHGPSGPKVNGVTTTALGVKCDAGWSWSRCADGVTLPGTSSLAILLRKAAAHAGWDEAWASPAAIDWLLGPVAVPKITADQIAALAAAAAVVLTAETAMNTAIDAAGASAPAVAAAILARDAAMATLVSAYATASTAETAYEQALQDVDALTVTYSHAVDVLLDARAALDGRTL